MATLVWGSLRCESRQFMINFKQMQNTNAPAAPFPSCTSSHTTHIHTRICSVTTIANRTERTNSQGSHQPGKSGVLPGNHKMGCDWLMSSWDCWSESLLICFISTTTISAFVSFTVFLLCLSVCGSLSLLFLLQRLRVKWMVRERIVGNYVEMDWERTREREKEWRRADLAV